MGTMLKTATANPPQPVPAAAGQWVNPSDEVVAQALARVNAPQTPVYNPEEVAQRQAANSYAQQWGLLGQMMGDERMAGAGGTVLKQALAERSPHVTERGTFDPLTGKFSANPAWQQEQAQGSLDRARTNQASMQQAHDTLVANQQFQQGQLREQIESRNQNAQLQREMLGANKAQAADQKNLQIAGHLNDKWEKVNRDDLSIRSGFETLSAIPKGAAGDISFVFQYMKMLDPGSVVKQDEFATAKNAAGVPERIRNEWNKLKSGGFLDANQRADFLAAAGALANQATTRIAGRNKYFETMADQYGVNRGWVIPEYGQSKPSGAPEAVAPMPAPPAADRRGGKDRRGAGALPAGISPDALAAELARRAQAGK